MSNLLLRVAIWILAGVSIVFNGAVLVLRRTATRTTHDKQHSRLILHLAAGDLLMGVYLALIGGADHLLRGRYFMHDVAWRASLECKLAGFLSTLSSQASVFLLLLITCDRFLKIRWPLRFQEWSTGAARAALVSVWLVAVVLAAVPLIPALDERVFRGKFYGRSGVCLALHLTPDRPPGWLYSVALFMGLNSAAMITIAVLYVWMFFSARDSRRSLRLTFDPSTSPSTTGRAVTAYYHQHRSATEVSHVVVGGTSTQSESDRRAERTMAIRIALIVLSNVACWLPIITIGVLSLVGVAMPPGIYAWVAVFVLPLNAALNPLIYTLSMAPGLRRLVVCQSGAAAARGRAHRTRATITGTGTMATVVTTTSNNYGAVASRVRFQMMDNTIQAVGPSAGTRPRPADLRNGDQGHGEAIEMQEMR